MRLNKSIYGLMQAGRNWWKTLDVWYKEAGYTRSQADQCVQQKMSESGEMITGTYTDDMLGGSSTANEMGRAKGMKLGQRPCQWARTLTGYLHLMGSLS